MRSREEIEERLRKAMEKRVRLERELEESSDPLGIDKFACAVAIGWTEVEIRTLRWVLGEQVQEEAEKG